MLMLMPLMVMPAWPRTTRSQLEVALWPGLISQLMLVVIIKRTRISRTLDSLARLRRVTYSRRLIQAAFSVPGVQLQTEQRTRRRLTTITIRQRWADRQPERQNPRIAAPPNRLSNLKWSASLKSSRESFQSKEK